MDVFEGIYALLNSIPDLEEKPLGSWFPSITNAAKECFQDWVGCLNDCSNILREVDETTLESVDQCVETVHLKRQNQLETLERLLENVTFHVMDASLVGRPLVVNQVRKYCEQVVKIINQLDFFVSKVIEFSYEHRNLEWLPRLEELSNYISGVVERKF